jgi:hypothetical protein
MNLIDPVDRSQAIAEAWRRHRLKLADWVERELINRTDRHGAYYIDAEGRTRPVMPREPLERPRLERHFEAVSASGVIGLLVMAINETCLWVVVDIDAHDGDGADPSANQRLALHVLARARDAGLTALLFDSNGSGGYHIWILLGTATPAASAYRLGKWLVHDHAEHGVARAPETFPKAAKLSGLRCGNWVRLPGKHSKRPHWTRVWGDGRWLEGEDAVAAILGSAGIPVDLGGIVPAEFSLTPVRAPSKPAPARRGRMVSSVSTAQPSPREVALAREALGHLGGSFLEDYDRWLRVGWQWSCNPGPPGQAIRAHLGHLNIARD